MVGVLLVVPTAYWIQLRLPRLRPLVEFITLLPLVIPAIVIVFGYLRIYNSSLAAAADRRAQRGTDLLLDLRLRRRWRCPTCTAPSTPACAPSTCAR